jgi:hypothetical protein
MPSSLVVMTDPLPQGLAELRRDPAAAPEGSESAADAFCRLACMVYGDEDGPDRWAEAASMLATTPELSRASIWAASAATDPDAVAYWLAQDPTLATREGGPHRFAPLMYLAYSRQDPAVSQKRVLAVADALLAAGADPNAGYLFGGRTPAFTVLAGAFGEGEQGPGNQPRHPHGDALARRLLQAGADPKDGQALYNRMFRADDSHLALLIEFGLGSADEGVWRGRLGTAMEPWDQAMARQIGWAVRHGFADRVRLLSEIGAAVHAPLPDGRLPIDVAARWGHQGIVDYLADGSPVPKLRNVSALAAAILGADEAQTKYLIEKKPDLLQRLLARRPALISQISNPAAVRIAAELGFDANAVGDRGTALHSAAWNGDVPLARALMKAGASLTIRDGDFNATPLGWAQAAHQSGMVAALIAAGAKLP